MTEKKTELLLESRERTIRDQTIYLMGLPKPSQIYLHKRRKCDMSYLATIVVESDDEISVHRKRYTLRFGRNGFYVKGSTGNEGCSYRKTGKSASRYRVWNVDPRLNNIKEGMFNTLMERVNPNGLQIKGNSILQQICTDGMRGYILSGRIFNTLDAMQYHIRYGLQGLGIKPHMANQLHKFYVERNEQVYQAKRILVSSEDPSHLLSVFETMPELGFQKKFDSTLVDQALALDEKINWADPYIDLEALEVRFSKKEKLIEELLYFWEGGPVLTKSARPVFFDKIDADDDIPF